MSDNSHNSHGSEAGHSDSHDIQSHLKVYWAVFAALLIGTLLTVGMYFVHFQSVALTVGIALFIASIKAFLVAGFFMHLLSEKKTIYSMLAVTGVFFVFMMFLIIWGSSDQPLNTVMKPLYVP